MDKHNQIMTRMHDHLREARSYFPDSRIVGIFLQGSQNYDLDIPGSDVDTKLIVVPTLDEICFNRKPHSTTHVRANEEHIDFKDIRLMFQTFRKQNLNFIEILFTPYFWLHPLYSEDWEYLVKNNEAIAHYNPYKAVKTMKGIAMEKYHAMEHEYPSKMEIIAKYGYDCKQLHHLLRVQYFLEDYIKDVPYQVCLHSSNAEYLKSVKKNLYDLDEAREVAAAALKAVIDLADNYCLNHKDVCDPNVDKLLDEVQHNIMVTSIKKELEVS